MAQVHVSVTVNQCGKSGVEKTYMLVINLRL